MPSQFEFSERRFKDVLLYVAQELSDDPTFGETKLNKVLYFADVETYRILGQPLTGAEYQKNHHGPTARRYTVLRDELLRRGQIKVERQLVLDHVQDVVRPGDVRANMSQFAEEEIAILDSVIKETRAYSNREVSDQSHERSAGWRALQLGDTIPYETWLIDPEPADDDAVEFLRRVEGVSA